MVVAMLRGWRVLLVLVLVSALAVLLLALSPGDDPGSVPSLAGDDSPATQTAVYTATPAPTSTPTSTPSATPTPAPGILLAAGDIASCTSRGDEQTATLIDSMDGTVATLGDNAYPAGTREEFLTCFEPSWGAFKERIRPALGNHDYGVADAREYFDYFGAAAGEPGRGYYSYETGAWHIIVLNSNCWAVGGCGPGAPQYQWLQSDLARSSATCTLAYWHHPLFSSGLRGTVDWMAPVWELLDGSDAEVVLVGHDHHYERFAPLDRFGNPTADGIRQFVVGTGGAQLYGVAPPAAHSEVLIAGEAGVLRLELWDGWYAWQFLSVDGTALDSGQDRCS